MKGFVFSLVSVFATARHPDVHSAQKFSSSEKKEGNVRKTGSIKIVYCVNLIADPTKRLAQHIVVCLFVCHCFPIYGRIYVK